MHESIYEQIECNRCGFIQYNNHKICVLCNTPLITSYPCKVDNLYDTWRLEQYLKRNGVEVIRIYETEDTLVRTLLCDARNEDIFCNTVLLGISLHYDNKIYLYNCCFDTNTIQFRF